MLIQFKFLNNKPKMAWFKFKLLITLKLNFNGGQFKNKCQKLVISKNGKIINKLFSWKLKILSNCIVKLEVENFDHLHLNTRVN